MKVSIGVITAMREELEPILEIGGGESNWDSKHDSDKFIYYVGEFPIRNREPIGVVATCALRKGPVAAAIRTTQFRQILRALAPSGAPIVCMTGITAGWREKVALGDVIVAENAYSPLSGKQVQQKFQPELDVGTPDASLLHWLENFADDSWKYAIKTPRPVSRRYQIDWLLWNLRTGDLESLPPQALDGNVPDRERLWPLLLKEGLITERGMLTEHGNDFVRRNVMHSPWTNGPEPDKPEPEVHFGDVASTPFVIEHDLFFHEQKQITRNIRAAEMEIQSFMSTCRSVGFAGFAVKGVCDYADSTKDDAFHKYAAEASARYLHSFVTRYANSIENFVGVSGPLRGVPWPSRRRRSAARKQDGTLRLKDFFPVAELQHLKDAMRAREYLVAFLSVSEEAPSRRYHLGHYYFVRMMDTLRAETEYRNVALMICDAFPLTMREASSAHSGRIAEQVRIWSDCFADAVPVMPIGPSAMRLPIEKEDRDVVVRLLELSGTFQRVDPSILQELHRWRFHGTRPPSRTIETLTHLINSPLGDSDGLLSLAYLLTRPPRWYSEAWFVRNLRYLACEHAAAALGARSIFILESFKNRPAWKGMALIAAEQRVGRFPNQAYFKSLPSATSSGAMRAADAAGVIKLRRDWRDHLAKDIDNKQLVEICRRFGIAESSKPADAVDKLVREGIERMGQQQ